MASSGGATVWAERRKRRQPGQRRALAAAAILGAALLGQACTGDDTDGRAEPSPEALSSGHELVLYEDERLRFLYPEGWDVEVRGGADERVFLEQPLDGDDGFPAAFITTSWPVLGADSLEFVRGQLGADPDRDEISELEEHAVELDGAAEALVQRFVATDGVPGSDEAVPYLSVFAATSSGRTFFAAVGIRDAAQLPADEYFEVFLDSLAFGAAAAPTANGTSILRPDDPRLEVAVPDDWTFDIGATWVEALAPDGEMRLRSSANAVEDDVMDALAGSAADTGRSVEPAVVAGAGEALRFEHPGDDDTEPTVSVAAISEDGQTLVTLTLIGHLDDPHPPGAREDIVASLRIGDAVGALEDAEDG